MILRNVLVLALSLVVLAVPGQAHAQGFDVGGFLAAELRWFPQSPAYPGQFSGVQASLVAAPELRYRTADRRHDFRFTPFLRLDSRDEERTHFDLREAYWRTVQGDWEVLVGFNKVFWGVTEARHLVDLVNQTDFVEDIDQEDKLGQAMINVAWQRGWGRLDGFVLLGFRERTFPGIEGRPRLPLPASKEALFPDGRRDVDFALRYSHYLGDVDLGVYVFRGTSREPAFVFSSPVPTIGPGDDPRQATAARLVPVYRTISQAGLDLQYTRDAWLWKLEAIVREGEGRTFGAFVGGFEYTLYQLGGGASDLGLLAEYLYDGRDETAPPTIFDNDLFVGARWALNDTQNTAILGGAVVDLRDGSTAARLEAERRLSDRLKLELDGRFFLGIADANALAPFSRDSFVNLRLAWGF